MHTLDERSVVCCTETQKIKLCCVVMEGGPGTLDTVHGSVGNGTPVVLIKHSGRVADLLVFAYENYKPYDYDAACFVFVPLLSAPSVRT